MSSKLMMGIYPNPTTGQFTLSFEESATGDVGVFDHTGKQIHQQYLENQKRLNIDLAMFPAGLYVVRFINDGGDVHSGRVILE